MSHFKQPMVVVGRFFLRVDNNLGLGVATAAQLV